MAATELWGYPLTTWFHAGVEIACIVFALWFFKGSRFSFLDGGWIRECAFMGLFLSAILLFRLVVFGIPVEVFNVGHPDDREGQLGTLILAIPFSLMIFGITFLFPKKVQRRRRRSYR